MRMLWVSCLVHALVLSAAPALAQAPPAESLPDPPRASQQPAATIGIPFKLEGCVAADKSPSGCTLYDPLQGNMSRLAASRVAFYAGKPVHVFGALLPTINMAAQAGSLDPIFPAMAYTQLNLSRSTPFNKPKPHVMAV